jgi:hypothetical protein
MPSKFWSTVLLAAALGLPAGCTAYVETKSPPPKVEVETKPAAPPVNVDVNVQKK